MKKKNLFIYLLVLIMVISIISGCSNSQSTTNGEKTANDELPYITIVTAPLGSGWYPISVLYGEFWMNQVEGLNVSVLEGGSVANIKAVSDGIDANVGWCYTTDLDDAKAGTGVFEKKYENCAPIGATYPVWLNIITLENSNINSIEDLLTAKANYGGVGSGSELAAQRLLEVGYGFNYDDIRKNGGTVEYGNYVDAATQLGDRNIDVMLAGGSPEVPPAREQEVQNQLRLVPASKEALEKVVNNGYNYIIDRPIPANTYAGQDEPVPAIAYQSLVVVNKSLPDDLVYVMTKEMWENIDRIREEQPARGNLMDVSTALEGVNLEDLHPGAERYYKEVGLIK